VTLEDGRLSAAVRTALLNDPQLGLRRIAVEARLGVITLSGAVRTSEEVQRAEKLARSVAGVRDVQSALRIEPSG
jgi:hyperosmotically inducible protein